MSSQIKHSPGNPGRFTEIKTGVEGQLNANLNVWGNVGVQVADRGYNDTSAMVGIKWQF
ncbi:autotransporter outer membrane beta-barrel domain-containing protein [Escherichia coli]|nr:autotransporter outer membrane beta-barrel domain-containing protein [Escherichia coli]